MKILFVFSVLIIVALFIPKRLLGIYFWVCAIILSSLYFFYVPPFEDDLYRHYELLEIAKDMSLRDILIDNTITNSNLYNSYIISAKVYLLYLFFISKLPAIEFLPVITTFIIYTLSFVRLNKIATEIDAPRIAIVIGFISFLCMTDYRDFSCIRNMLAYALFSYIIYEELVNNKNKYIAFLLYGLLCLLHMSCVVLLGLRLILGLSSKKHIKQIVVIALLSIYTLTPYILGVMAQFFNTPYLAYLVEKISIYRLSRTAYNWHGAMAYITIITAQTVLYRYVIKNKIYPERFKRYNTYTLFVLAFTIGAFGQYDILRRSVTLMTMLFLPYIVMAFSAFTNATRRPTTTREPIIYIGYGLVLLCSLLFLGWISYRPMDQCFL